MSAMMPTFSMKNFVRLIQQADSYPFYCALLYTPEGGLDARIHEYVKRQWQYLNGLTGYSCLMFAVEDVVEGPSIEDFKPEEVYDIARYLGASVDHLPCMVFFTEPRRRNDTLILKLGDFLPEPGGVTDEDLTSFFRAVQSNVDACGSSPADFRLQCLRDGLEKRWPKESRWAGVWSGLSTAGGWLITSVTTGSTVVQAVASIIKTVSPLLTSLR